MLNKILATTISADQTVYIYADTVLVHFQIECLTLLKREIQAKNASNLLTVKTV